MLTRSRVVCSFAHEEVRGDDPELAKPLQIEVRELEVGGRN
jgi:hypothetical protein